MNLKKVINKSISMIVAVFIISSISSVGVSAAEHLNLIEEEVSLELYHETDEKLSSANGCIEEIGVIKENNGEYRLHINLGKYEKMGMVGYLSDLYYYGDEEAYKSDVKSELKVEAVNELGYPSEISIPMTAKLNTIYLGFRIAIPSMPSFNMSHIARLKITYSDTDEGDNGAGETTPDEDNNVTDESTPDNSSGQVDLEDGIYTIPASFVKTNSDEESKANECLEEGKIIVENGVARIYLTLKEADFFGIASSITEMYYYRNETEYKNGNKLEVTVEKVNEETSYPEVVSFELPSNSEYIYISTLAIGHDDLISMRLKLDYNKIEVYEETYADGLYEVNINLLNASKDELSMANNALEQKAKIKIENGIATIYISTKPLTLGTITASLQTLEYENLDGTYSYAEVTKKSVDGNPTEFKFVLPSYDEVLNIKVNPMVAMMGNQPIAARLNVDYSTMVEVKEDSEMEDTIVDSEGTTSEKVEGATGTTTTTTTTIGSTTTKTGDNSNMKVLIIISLVSLSVIGYSLTRKKGEKYENIK